MSTQKTTRTAEDAHSKGGRLQAAAAALPLPDSSSDSAAPVSPLPSMSGKKPATSLRQPPGDENATHGADGHSGPATEGDTENSEGNLPLAACEPLAMVNDDCVATAASDAASKAFREDPRVDRRIIEGMLQDRDNFIKDMETQGYTEAAVLRRAAELGLSEALIRQVKGVAADLAGERPGRRPAPSSLGARTCLSCDRIFLSSGPGNRLCMRCRGGDAGLAQL